MILFSGEWYFRNQVVNLLSEQFGRKRQGHRHVHTAVFETSGLSPKFMLKLSLRWGRIKRRRLGELRD